ncbi:MAG TPA: serine hydrolase domain-containing protein [Chitinophagaceae bacterium]|jgi:CubicO group peptidase (beta-lactamase class C family)|nr:serine hydrolase domain-containing protein [Chitinophagaceae bacterium]
MKYLLTILFLFLLLKIQAQQTEEVDSLVNELEQLRLQFKIPSISYAVIKDQKIVYSGGLGYADSINNIQASDSTIYSIASLTKPISAIIIAKLVEQGLLKWDDRMRDYWSGYKNYYDSFFTKWKQHAPSYFPLIKYYNYERTDITIRHHLSHTSEGVPGTEFKYNGFIYGGVSIVVDNRFKLGFKALLQKEIINKLELNYSAVDYESIMGERLKSLLSVPYEYKNGNLVLVPNYPQPHTISGASGFLSSVKDLALFDIALDKGKLISPQSFKQLTTPFTFSNGKQSVYGLGWFITALNGEKVFYHHGLQESFSAIYLKIPKRQLSLILLSNCPLLTLKYHPDLLKGKIQSNPFIDTFLKWFYY